MTVYRETYETATTALMVLRLLRNHDRYGTTVLDRIRDAHAGQPSAVSYDGDKITASGTSDPTARAALTTDHAKIHLAELQRAIHTAHSSLERALAIVHTYTPRPPSALDRARMADANDPRCECCAQLDVADGMPRWEPPVTSTRSTVSGRLTEPAWLCRWCYDHVAQTGVKPTVDELDQHHSGQRIRCDHPPYVRPERN